MVRLNSLESHPFILTIRIISRSKKNVNVLRQIFLLGNMTFRGQSRRFIGKVEG